MSLSSKRPESEPSSGAKIRSLSTHMLPAARLHRAFLIIQKALIILICVCESMVYRLLGI